MHSGLQGADFFLKDFRKIFVLAAFRLLNRDPSHRWYQNAGRGVPADFMVRSLTRFHFAIRHVFDQISSLTSKRLT